MAERYVNFEQVSVSVTVSSGPGPDEIPEELRLSMARQLEHSVDLRMRYLMGDFEAPTNFPPRRRHGGYFYGGVMS